MKVQKTFYVTMRLDIEYDTDKTDEANAMNTALAVVQDVNKHTIESGVRIDDFEFCGYND